MEKEFDFRNHQVGDKVYHIVNGWVKIKKKYEDFFYVEEESIYYNGKFIDTDENPTIYPYNPFEERMINVKKIVGFVPRELIKILPDNSVLCWESEEKKYTAIYKEWREIQPEKELTIDQKILILWKKHQENGR